MKQIVIFLGTTNVEVFALLLSDIALNAGIQRGGGGLELQNIGFLSNTDWSGSPENHKAFKPVFNVGPSLARQQNAI